jgi:opacity protein-like surface antigen
LKYPWFRSVVIKQAAVLVPSLLAALASQPAAAGDPLGLYLGGAVGQSRVEADGANFNAASFKENHSAYKAMVGIRPISSVGVEAAYLDFGHPTGTLGGAPADVTMKGASVFGMLYLPVPVVDVYAKVGFARLQSTVNGALDAQTICGPPCPFPLFQLSRTNTSFAAGAGVQFKMGSVAVRGEYERFNAAGGNPGLLSLGLTWTFL